MDVNDNGKSLQMGENASQAASGVRPFFPEKKQEAVARRLDQDSEGST